MMACMADKRRTRATDGQLRGQYRVLRAQFLRRCAAEGVECAFDDGPIDYSLPYTDAGAATVHHTISPVVRPDLELETSLWKPAHSICNKVGMPAYDPDGVGAVVVPGSENGGYGIPSEDWS